MCWISIWTQVSSRTPDDRIVIVTIDDASLQELEPAIGSWPWPRAVTAAIIDYCSEARVIAVDVLFVGLDNDCDGGIDEGTLGFDDDGDSVAEADGDCDDRDPSTYPGAYEEADQKDNDCDGIVDEGTALYDDDGDGFFFKVDKVVFVN